MLYAEKIDKIREEIRIAAGMDSELEEDSLVEGNSVTLKAMWGRFTLDGR